MKKSRALLILGLLLVALYGLYRFKYQLSYLADLRARPWAYSADPAAKLLVGRWQGAFVDPAGVAKRISLEILVPLTEEERERRASRRTRRKGVRHRDKRSFDGSAVVSSRLGEERYLVFGAVAEEDVHKLELGFRVEDEARRLLPNDRLRAAPSGHWQGDRLELELAFTREDAQGSSRTVGEGVVVNGQVVWQEAPEDKPVQVVLERAPP